MSHSLFWLTGQIEVTHHFFIRKTEGNGARKLNHQMVSEKLSQKVIAWLKKKPANANHHKCPLEII
jgi:hypothetical protein